MAARGHQQGTPTQAAALRNHRARRSAGLLLRSKEATCTGLVRKTAALGLRAPWWRAGARPPSESRSQAFQQEAS